jgi:predicted secreted protein
MKRQKLLLAAVLTALCLFAVLARSEEAKRFKLNFYDAYLIYVPADGTLQIITQGNVLSYGSDWKVMEIKPFLFAMKQDVWKGFFWKVNTSRGEVHMVRGVKFGNMGGTEKKLDGIKVEAVGRDRNPKRFLLKFDSAYMAYIPGQGMPQIVTEGVVLSYCNDWHIKELKPFLFHFRQNNWKEFFWHINTSRKEVNRIMKGVFGELGGKLEKLNIGVELY